MPPERTQTGVRSASADVNGLVGLKTNITPEGAGVENEPAIWSVEWPIACPNSRAAEVPLAASLLELCSGESWCGWTRYAAAAIAIDSSTASIQPRAPLMLLRVLAGEMDWPPAPRAHTLRRRPHDRRRWRPQMAPVEGQGAKGQELAGRSRARSEDFLPMYARRPALRRHRRRVPEWRQHGHPWRRGGRLRRSSPPAPAGPLADL